MATAVEKLPDYLGHLVMNEEGDVLHSGGELNNAEAAASAFIKMIDLVSADTSGSGVKKISLTYSDHCYMIALSNRKINVVKKKFMTRKELEESI